MNINDINKIINRLKERDECFVSERHFQVEFIITAKELYPEYEYLPEYVFVDFPEDHVDLIIKDKENKLTAVEFKYVTRKFETNQKNTKYNLKNHSATDQRRYDILKDISRMENQKADHSIIAGYMITLTNVEALWNPRRNKTMDQDFKIFEEGIKAGEKDWDDKASKGTKGKREESIFINKDYEANDVKWTEYSNPEGIPDNARTFKVQIIEVK